MCGTALKKKSQAKQYRNIKYVTNNFQKIEVDCLKIAEDRVSTDFENTFQEKALKVLVCVFSLWHAKNSKGPKLPFHVRYRFLSNNI